MKWSIRKKLSLSFTVILAFLVLSTAVTLVLSFNVRKTSEEIANRQYPSMKMLDELTIKLYRKRIVYDQYFPTKSKKYKDEINTLNEEFQKLYDQYKKNITQHEKAVLDQLEPELQNYNGKLDDTLEFLKKYPDNLEGIMKQVAIADNHFDKKILPLIDQMHQEKNKATTALVKKLKDDLSKSNVITIIVGFIAIVFGAIFAAALGKGISKPVVELTKAADEISIGKIDTKISVKTQDEINELAQAIERMRMSLKKAMERLAKK